MRRINDISEMFFSFYDECDVLKNWKVRCV